MALVAQSMMASVKGVTPSTSMVLKKHHTHHNRCRSRRCSNKQRLRVQAMRDTPQEQQQKRRRIEDELKDPKNFVEYLVPRPLRLAFLGGSAASCLIATLLSAARLLQDPALVAASGLTDSGAVNLAINAAGCAAFAALFVLDSRGADARMAQRKELRQRQIAFGDREVFVNESGERMSRLKEVNDEWIVRRLERWGKKDRMPFIGPVKGALLQQLVREHAPQAAAEVGTMAGYSALLIAQALPRGARLVSIEKDLQWLLAAKRFCWQAAQGGAGSAGGKVDVWLGDGRDAAKWAEVEARLGRPIELLLLDGTPKETLAYLRAAESHLAPGALVIADNAGVFAEGGMKPYLAYVRSSPNYSSKYMESTLEWREDVADGLEVSTWLPQSTAAGLSSTTQAHNSDPS